MFFFQKTREPSVGPGRHRPLFDALATQFERSPQTPGSLSIARMLSAYAALAPVLMEWRRKLVIFSKRIKSRNILCLSFSDLKLGKCVYGSIDNGG